MASWQLICLSIASLSVTQGQLPPLPPLNSFGSSSPHPAGSPAGLSTGASPDGAQAALQDAVEGIAGLMQRFEQMQPQLGSIPRSELESIVNEGQLLHGRFMELQEKMRVAASGIGGPVQEQSRIIGFHRDLALFIERVENKLGITGPTPPSLVSQGVAFSGAPAATRSSSTSAFDSMPPLPSMGGQEAPPPASFGRSQTSPASGSVSSATDQRLQRAMGGIVSGMQRFEALHPKLQSLPQPVFHSIASRGQQLHEHFVVLQKRGVDLAGDGNRQMSEADATNYAAQLEAFVAAQTGFVTEAEAQVQGSLGAGSAGLPPAGVGLGRGGSMGSPLPPVSSAGSGLGQGLMGGSQQPAFGSGPPLSATSFSAPGGLGAGGAGSLSGPGSSAAPQGMGRGDRVTPSTDQRLSGVISKVVSLMQEFEALRPQLSRLPQQAFSQIAQKGQELNDRFVALQRRGASIAGDGTVSMLERDAHEYAGEMEAFFQDQSAFVDQAKQSVQSIAGGMGLTGGALGGASLSSASLPGSSQSSALGGGGLGAASFNGRGNFPGSGLSGAAPGGAGLGGAGLGGAGLSPRSSFGSSSFGGPSQGAFSGLGGGFQGSQSGMGAAGSQVGSMAPPATGLGSFAQTQLGASGGLR